MWFTLLISIQMGFWFFLVLSHRLPAGHDTFQYLTLQYYFLNHSIEHGSIPQWMPFMTQGTVATWWYMVQSSFLQQVLLLSGSLLKGLNFFYAFYANMLVDQLFLAVGCWLWGGYYLKTSQGRFFFAATVFASSIYLTQVWFNFHFFYCLPLIFYFGHQFLETGQWRYFLLLANLFIMQIHGNLLYYIPFHSYVIFLYFALQVMLNRSVRLDFLKIRLNKYGIVCLVLCGLTLVTLWFEMGWGTKDIINYSRGRDYNSMVSINNFLTYGGHLGYAKWKECISGVSLDLDRNLYMGLAALPLIVWGFLFSLKRNFMHIVILIIILLDMSAGGVTAYIAYKLWPIMPFYRHLGLISVVAKLFLCLLAAYGFESLGKRYKHLQWGPVCVTIAICLLIFFRKIYGSFLDVHFNQMFMIAVILTIIFFLWVRVPKWCSWLIALLMAVHIIDLGIYQYHEMKFRSFQASVEDLKMLDFRSMPFAQRREPQRTKEGLPIHTPPLKGVQYWTYNSFLFRDVPGGEFQTVYWHWPLDRLMRAYWGQKIDDPSVKPLGLEFHQYLDFPLEHTAARKFSGVDLPKIQMFTNVLTSSDDQQTAQWISDSRYLGDVPIVAHGTTTKNIKDQLSINSRLSSSYKILYFSADQLRISFPKALDAPLWLMYSDVWHKQWRAFVDGQETPVERANLAYKIIHVDKGAKEVRFDFHDPWLDRMHRLFNVNALIWIIIVFYLFGRICKDELKGAYW